MTSPQGNRQTGCVVVRYMRQATQYLIILGAIGLLAVIGLAWVVARVVDAVVWLIGG